MSIRRHLRRCGEWFRGTSPRPAARPRTPQLRCESLEERITPTILFTPAFGAEQDFHLINNPVLPSAPVYLIFWGGNEWGNGQGNLNATATSTSAADFTFTAFKPTFFKLAIPEKQVTELVADVVEPTSPGGAHLGAGTRRGPTQK